MKKYLLRTLALLGLFPFASTGFGADQSSPPVAGGVMFRTDDNGQPGYWRGRAGVFDKHGAKMGAAVNLVAAEGNPGLIAAFQEMQKSGHDLMDHAPTHDNIAINFVSDEDVEFFRKHAGVDHFASKKAFLKYDLTVPPVDRESRRVKVSGNQLSPLKDEGADRWFKDYEFLYFPELKTLARYNDRDGKNGVYTLVSPWREKEFTMGDHADVAVQRVAAHEVLPTPEAVDVLVESVRRVCARHQLTPPVTYIAPGGQPRLTKEFFKRTYGEKHGYRSAAVYPEAVARVFNEADPDGTAPYAMQWGDVSDEQITIAELKNRIANLLAVNKVVIVGSHQLSKEDVWPAYFEKMDALLAWLKEKKIPIKSHAEWANVLYRSDSKLTGNIFPSLDRDLDGDGKPDGYDLGVSKFGPAPLDAGLPETHMLTVESAGVILRMPGLGGLPHGAAEIGCWISGPAGAQVTIRVDKVGTFPFTLKDGWNHYMVSLAVPADMATTRIDFSRTGGTEGPVSLCGISLAGATPGTAPNKMSP